MTDDGVLRHWADKRFRIRLDIAAEFKKASNILGLSETEAAELAFLEWLEKHADEAQQRLEIYSRRGIVIEHAGTVNVGVFQRAEVWKAREELERLITILPRVQDPATKRKFKRDLAGAISRTQPVFVKTRDPELSELVRKAEALL